MEGPLAPPPRRLKTGALLLAVVGIAPIAGAASSARPRPRLAETRRPRKPPGRHASYPVPSGAMFVSPSGSDANLGTASAPEAHEGRVAASASGRTIVLRKGTYHEALVNVEDLWEEILPQNVPATNKERPNWRRRIRPSIEQIRKMAGGARCSPMSLLSDHDLYLFNEGSHVKLYERLGSHIATVNGRHGTNFAVWAPDAETVSVMGAFQRLEQGQAIRCSRAARPGIWEGFVPDVGKGESYKYHVVSRYHGYRSTRPIRSRFIHETPPHTASIVWDLDYEWHDQAWMATRGDAQLAARADVDLRSASRLVAARAGRRQPLAELSRDGAAARGLRGADGLHARRVSAGDGASRSTARGDIRRPAISRRPAATARRRISCTSSITCTSTASA